MSAVGSGVVWMAASCHIASGVGKGVGGGSSSPIASKHNPIDAIKQQLRMAMAVMDHGFTGHSLPTCRRDREWIQSIDDKGSCTRIAPV